MRKLSVVFEVRQSLGRSRKAVDSCFLLNTEKKYSYELHLHLFIGTVTAIQLWPHGDTALQLHLLDFCLKEAQILMCKIMGIKQITIHREKKKIAILQFK